MQVSTYQPPKLLSCWYEYAATGLVPHFLCDAGMRQENTKEGRANVNAPRRNGSDLAHAPPASLRAYIHTGPEADSAFPSQSRPLYIEPS